MLFENFTLVTNKLCLVCFCPIELYGVVTIGAKRRQLIARGLMTGTVRWQAKLRDELSGRKWRSVIVTSSLVRANLISGW